MTFCLLSIVLAPAVLCQEPALHGHAVPRDLPPLFVENAGQWSPTSRFVARRPGLIAHFEERGFALQLLRRDGQKLRAEVIRLGFENARDSATLVAEDEQLARFHYFKGTDSIRGHTARTFGGLRYRDVWRGVDLRVRDDGGVLAYDVVLAPDACLDDVVVRCDGVEDLRVEVDGRLVLVTAAGPLRQSRPVAWLEDPRGGRTPVACRFRRIDAQHYGFDAPDLASDQTLVIDPGIEWSTFVGGNNYEYFAKMVLDAAGRPVAAGYAASADFPTTTGSYDISYNGRIDAVVTKLAADGSTLIWSTFIGGGAEDYATGLALSAAGEPTIVGSTQSNNYPTTAGAYQTMNGGGSGDAFVTRLTADGSSLAYSTYLGATDWDYASGVDVDAAGNATVIGVTKSANFTVTPGAFDTSHNGGGDGFVVRFDPTGSRLLFSTFLGSSGWDPLNDVLVDAAGDVFVVGDIFGVNNASNFPTTPGAYDPTYNDTSDRSDTIVCKLSSDGATLLWSTWLGGDNWDPCYSIALDDAGNPTICGESWSTNFPVTANAYQGTNNGDGDVYVARVSADGSRLVFATLLGGRWEDRATRVGLDPFGAIVIGGFTQLKNSPLPNDFPTTPGAFSRTFNGTADAFVARLSPDASKLYHSTLINGSGGDRVYAMALDARGAAFVSGDTFGADFPTTPGAFDTSYNGLGDAFVALAEVLPLGTTRFGPWSPACSAATPIGITVEPRENASDFALLGGGAPPATAGVLVLGAGRSPVPLPILGALVLIDVTMPVFVVPVVSDALGRSVASLPLGGGLSGVRVFSQLIWLNTPGCGGFGTLSSSNGLDLSVR